MRGNQKKKREKERADGRGARARSRVFLCVCAAERGVQPWRGDGRGEEKRREEGK